jgi:hypothetical protein
VQKVEPKPQQNDIRDYHFLLSSAATAPEALYAKIELRKKTASSVSSFESRAVHLKNGSSIILKTSQIKFNHVVHYIVDCP